MNRTRPLISYYGGKQRLSNKIVPLIPKHTVYVEPFAGGLAILFAKPVPIVTNTDHYREVINDIDNRLITFYRVAKSNPEELNERIQATPYSEFLFNESREILRSMDEYSDIDIAWAYYIQTQWGFGNRLFSGWKRSTYGCNPPYTHKSRLICLESLLERVSTLYIACSDAIDCIQRWDSPQTFFYCDPPYPGSDQGHYAGYTQEDFISLVVALKECRGSFILSCYEQSELVIPSDWERFDFNTVMSTKRSDHLDRSKKSSNRNRSRTEVVYRRFSRVPVRSEIQRLYDTGKYDCFI